MIFDNQVRIYSTCRDCRQAMHVINHDETNHPTCTPKPTKMESLAAGWLSTVLAGDSEAEKLTADEITKLDSQPPELRRAAIRYAQWGWPVFPLRGRNTTCNGGTRCQTTCECPKKPATKNGFHDATSDPQRIDQWWRRHPDHNIGIATGQLFDVFDIDTPTGLQPFLSLLQQGRVPDTHGIVVTASGGLHLYLEARGKGNRAAWKPGLDYRGNGGYVVAPPSTLGKPGRAWSWMVAPSPTIKVAA